MNWLNSFSSKIYLIVIASLLSLLLVSGIGNYFLKKSSDKWHEKFLNEETQHIFLKEDLKDKNLEIEAKEKEFKKWKAKKPKVKYKTVYKYKKEVKDATCEDKVKALSTINFSDLN